jgi:lipopolysaccharide/colanic/teichoic acid biosynthesis glycosyltransferase
LSYNLAVTPSVRVTKRAIDICASLCGLAVTAPLYPFIAAAIKLEDPGPIFYQQRRAGVLKSVTDIGGIATPEFVEFKMSKFRTMRVDAEKLTGAVLAQENDPRVTRVGRFLRKTRLDELPQFWNVLKGEMSLVGTRPPTDDETAAYLEHHQRRLSIKPGLTGLWQLNGNGAVKDFEEVVKLDCEYIDNWSLWLDAKIVAKTITKVMRGDAW